MEFLCHHRNSFCYDCGLFIDKSHKYFLSKSAKVVSAYNAYFGIDVIVNKWYAPEIVCTTCARTLLGCTASPRTHSSMPFGKPMIWHSIESHHTENCYFCLGFSHAFGHSYKNRANIEYPDVSSATKPEPFNTHVSLWPSRSNSPEQELDFANLLLWDEPESSAQSAIVVAKPKNLSMTQCSRPVAASERVPAALFEINLPRESPVRLTSSTITSMQSAESGIHRYIHWIQYNFFLILNKFDCKQAFLIGFHRHQLRTLALSITFRKKN